MVSFLCSFLKALGVLCGYYIWDLFILLVYIHERCYVFFIFNISGRNGESEMSGSVFFNFVCYGHGPKSVFSNVVFSHYMLTMAKGALYSMACFRKYVFAFTLFQLEQLLAAWFLGGRISKVCEPTPSTCVK